MRTMKKHKIRNQKSNVHNPTSRVYCARSVSRNARTIPILTCISDVGPVAKKGNINQLNNISQ